MIRLNDREEEIMKILWRLERAFVKEIILQLKPPVPPYNTVLSMIRKLEKDGYVSHNNIGRSHQYIPKISKLLYQKSLLQHLVTEYFGSSPKKFLSFFLKDEDLSQTEIMDILEKYKKEEK